MIGKIWPLLFLGTVIVVLAQSIYSTLQSYVCLPYSSTGDCLTLIIVNVFGTIMGLSTWMIFPFSMLLFSVALPIGGVIFLYSSIVNNDGDRLSNFFLGTGLLVGSYFFITRLSLNFISSLYGWISNYLSVLS
jgi:uncharacterized membrane protein